MEAKAVLRGARISAQKVRLVADLIRGHKLHHALSLLSFVSKKGAVIVRRLLESAIANAEYNAAMDIDELRVKKIHIEKAPVMKRFSARAKGRGVRVLKHSCHIYVTVGA